MSLPCKLTKEEMYELLVYTASLSPARKRKVGSVIAIPLEDCYLVLATGYNYNPSGGPCETEDNLTHPNVIHAEVAAVENLPQDWKAELAHRVGGGTSISYSNQPKVYTTHPPCTGCLASMKAWELKHEVWRKNMFNESKETNLESTLKERGSRYGDFTDNARVHQNILNVMMIEKGWNNLSDVHKSSLDLFAQKVARILNGDPNYKDNWHDIAGYAKLAEDRCK